MSEFNRSSGKKNKKSRVLKFGLFTLNLYFLFLLFSASWLFTATQYFLVITIGLFVLDIAMNKKAKSQYFKHRRSSLTDFFRLSRKYFKINKRYVLVSILGLVLATIMISQTILTNSSYQQNSLENFLARGNSNAFQIELQNIEFNTKNSDYIQSQISAIENVVVSKLETSSMEFDDGVTSIFSQISIVTRTPEMDPEGYRYVNTYSVRMSVWNDDIESTLKSLPTFNPAITQNDSLLIVNEWWSPDENPLLFESPVSILVGDSLRDSFSDESFYYVNQTISNRWVPTERDFDAIYKENDWRVSSLIRQTLFVSETTYFEILDKINTVAETQNIDNYMLNGVQYDVHVKIPDLTTTSIDELVFELDQMVNSLRSELLSQSVIQDVWLYSPLADTLREYQFQREAFGVALIMISLPLIGVSLFLVYFSLTLVEKRKSKVIAIMKIRGSSKEQLRLMQFAEVMVAGTIAAIAGMILSIPWALITFRVSDFFEFEADPIGLVIPASWYWRLPQIAVILTIDLNINSLLSLSDTSIDEGEDVEEKKPPFWQRLYLDLIIFSLSVGILLFVRTFPVSDTILLQFLLFGIAPWAIFAILLTSPLVVARYFSTLISFISDFLWKVQGGMLALATRNMRKNRFSSSRLTALLMLGMMLSFVSIIIPTSLVSYEIEQINYNVGADVYISNLDIDNQTILDLTNVEGVKTRTEIIKSGISLYSNNDFGYQGGIRDYQFLGVNTSSFSNSAFWRENYAENELDEILSKLNNVTVGTSKKQLKALGIKQGNKVPNLPNNISDITVTTTFDYFPNLISYEPIEYDGYIDAWTIEFLAQIDFVRSLENISSSFTTGVYLKLKDDANATKVEELLISNFENYENIEIQTVHQELNRIQDAEEFKIILSSFQSMLIITVLISIIAVSYFTFITLSERNKEIGTFRAIGMVKKQIFVLLIVEAMIMLVSGIILGAITGWFVASNFFYLISNPGIGGIVPPQTLYIPWRLTFGFLGTMFVATGIAAGLPAQQVASKQTGNVLRAE